MLVVTSPPFPCFVLFSGASGRNIEDGLDARGPAHRIKSQYLSRSVQILTALLITCREGSPSHSTPGDQENCPLGSS